jgi:Na+/melibiose symporter-like transporter
MFCVMFFMTFYVQAVLGISAVQTGVAFLPLPLALVVVGAVIGPRLNVRFGPRVIVPTGMMLGCVSTLLLTRITTSDDYSGHILPSLIILGTGLGLVLPASVSAATFGARGQDAGVASALVNTFQQVGGAVTIAIFNTVATTAVAGYLVGRTPTPAVLADAAVHSYTIVFVWVAVMFLLGAVGTALFSRSGNPTAIRQEVHERTSKDAVNSAVAGDPV